MIQWYKDTNKLIERHEHHLEKVASVANIAHVPRYLAVWLAFSSSFASRKLNSPFPK